MAACPECGREMRFCEADWIETHGEPFHDEWYECPPCGTKYTVGDLEELIFGSLSPHGPTD